MYDILPQLIIILSIAGILGIVFRKIPKVSQVLEKETVLTAKKKTKRKLRASKEKIDWEKYRTLLASKSGEIFSKAGKGWWRMRQELAGAGILISKFVRDLNEEAKKWMRDFKKKSQDISSKSKNWASEKKKIKEKIKFKAPVLKPTAFKEKVASLVKSRKPSSAEIRHGVSLHKDSSTESVRDKDSISSKVREEMYIRLIAMNPRNINAYKRLGDIYLKEKNYRDARETFRHILRLNPDDEESREKLEAIERER